MPIRDSSPGPSTLNAPADVLQPHNAKKRASSEIPADDESRQPKKHRKDLELSNVDDKAVASVNSLKDKDEKKKRKKKKRKSPLTIPEIDVERAGQAAANSRASAAPVSLASSTTLSEASVSPPVTTSAPAHNKDDTARAESLQSTVEEGEKPSLSSANKGKGKAASESPDNLISQETVSASLAGPSHESDSLKEAQAKIAELTVQLQVQKTLLSRHEDNLSHLQQSLTCEICLDLLYKPFALSPCGHVACYMCLIRWFTSLQNNGNNNNNIEPPAEFADVPALLNSRAATRGDFLHNKKTCPLCRASIHDRPAEIWSIKSMVAHLVKSKLVDLPSEPPPSATETPPNGGGNNTRFSRQNDPWRNVFPRPKTRGYHIPRGRQFFPPPPENNEGGEDGGWGVEEMGMYDAEDGGIYRCIECMHEIWGGVCTSCHREYPGHARFDDDDDDDDGWDDGDGDEDDHGGFGGNFLGRRLREIWRGYNDQAIDRVDEDDGGEDDDDDDIDIGEFYDALRGPMELTDDDDESMSEEHSDLDDDDDSEGEWTSDEGGEGEVVYPGFMFNGFHMLPVHRRGRRAIEPERAGHIEEVNGDFEDQEGEEERDEDEEEQESEEDFDSDHSHPDSDYEDSFIDDDGIDGDGPGVAYGIWGGPNLRNRQIARRLGMAARLGGDSPPLPPPAPGRRLDPRAAAAVAAVLRGNYRSGRRRESPIVVEDDDEEEDGDNDDAWQDGPDKDYEDGNEDEEEEEDPEFECGFLTQNGRGRRRQVVYDVDEDEDDGDEEGQEIRPSGSRRRRGGSAGAGPSGRGRRAHVVYDVDDEGSEID